MTSKEQIELFFVKDAWIYWGHPYYKCEKSLAC